MTEDEFAKHEEEFRKKITKPFTLTELRHAASVLHIKYASKLSMEEIKGLPENTIRNLKNVVIESRLYNK